MKKIIVIATLTAIMCFLPFCERGAFDITLTADAAAVSPGASTVLRCDVDNPQGLELVFDWSVDVGSIQELGDTAVWTAPEDFTWSDYIVTVSIAVSDPDGNIEEDNIDLQVDVSSQAEYANEDTYTFSYSPDLSYASGEFLRVGFDSDWGTNDAFFHAFLMFPTPIIPSGEELRGARLRLWREYSEGDEMELEIYLPLENWSAEGLSWNTEPDAVDFAMISDNNTDVGYFYITLTSLVEEWLDGSRNNYGLMLRVSDETDYTHRYRDYGAMEGAQSKWPALEVVSW